eukprot:TRINITY_DN3836_c0_g1_i8.p3 TRINITY_DN3836_c0_g1~~TRINITY_DN3836_c0_g1_i8.p3  ORF type:complete len:234 (+),score=67.48 TRINITY_DN3836_c0_g1_i8:181-882(+)
MRRERRIANATPLYKRSCPKLLDKSTVQTPTGMSLAIKLRGPLFARSSTNQSFVLRTQRQPKANKNNEQPHVDSYTSSKEKLLLSRIIALKKEKNEMNLMAQQKENNFKKKARKLQAENNSLKEVFKKVIPYVSSAMSPRSKAQIQSLLENIENANTTDKGTQCSLVSPESESGSNKASTEPHSTDTADLSKLKADATENVSLKAFIKYSMAAKLEESANVLPTFIRSLNLAN